MKGYFQVNLECYEAMRQMELDYSDGYLCEKQLRRKDGRLIFVNVDTRCVRAQNRSISFIISVIEDISQRKASEHQLKHQRNLYEMLSQTNQAIVHCQDREALFKQICQIAVEHGGFTLALIGKYYKDLNDIDVLHSFGDDNGFSSWVTEHKKLQPELLTRIGPPVYTVDQMNNLLDQMNENHQAEKAELLAEIQRLRAELHAEVDSVKTTVNTEAYLNSGD
jgi:hypothetical protein